MPKNEKIIYVYDSFTFDEPKLPIINLTEQIPAQI